MPNMYLRILDPDGHLVRAGDPGELCIGGICLSRGYLKRDDLTREKFITDPFAGSVERLYRSGDRAMYRPDGAIVLLGRIDDQVKLRGHRIEPGGIEAVLETHAAVRQSVVLAKQAADDHVLVAYVETSCPPGSLDGELRALLRRFLPDYMIPAAFIYLTEFPLNANAKLDRQALQALPLRTTEGDDTAQSDLESQLVQIFQAVLPHHAVGVSDDFAALGLDSLAAVRIARNIESQLDVKLPIGLLLRSRNIRQIAAALESLEEDQKSATGAVSKSRPRQILHRKR